MRIGILVFLLAFASVGRAGAEKIPAELQAQRDKLAQDLLALDADTEKKLAALRQQYDEDLVKLKQARQAEGDLDSVLEVEAERKRVASKPTAAMLESHSVSSTLKPARAAFLKRCRDLQPLQNSKQTDLIRAYVAKLKLLQKDLTKANRIEDAVAVRNEVATYQDMVGETAPAPEPAPGAAAPPSGSALILNPMWKRPPIGVRRTCEELTALLQTACDAKSDLSAHPDLKLYGEITYLMPAAQVAVKLSKGLGIRRAIACDAFPKDCFFSVTVDGYTGDGFTKFLLVTDYANQVVGVALVNENVTDATSTTSTYATGGYRYRAKGQDREWTIYDFIRGGTKGSKQTCITHETKTGGETVQLTTRLLGWKGTGGTYHERSQGNSPCDTGYAYGWTPQAKETVCLILAKPVAEFLLDTAR